MRIWFVPVEEHDDRHLLGEHGELHTIANAILRGGGGWYNHPGTNLFKGRLGALYRRHEQQVAEMQRRGWNGHRSAFPVDRIPSEQMDAEIEVTEEMLEIDRRDLAERQRLTALNSGGSWRKAETGGLQTGGTG